MSKRTELCAALRSWSDFLLGIYDRQQVLDKQKKEVKESEDAIVVLESQLPENILKEYEALQIVWKLKGLNE